MKYILFEDKGFVLFNEDQSHADLRLMGRTPKSAGYYDDGKTYGASMSLGIGSNPDDIKMIEYTHVCCKCNDKIGVKSYEELEDDYGWVGTWNGWICHQCDAHS